MSSLPEPNEVIRANPVGINRLGLECCDDMQGPQMEECEVDSHDMTRPDKGYHAVITSLGFHLSFQSPCLEQKVLWKANAIVVGLKQPGADTLSQCPLLLHFTVTEDIIRIKCLIQNF